MAYRTAVLAAAMVSSLSACSPAASPPPVVVEPTVDVPRLDGGVSQSANDTGGVKFGRIPPVVGARWAVSIQARSEAEHVDPRAAGGTSTQLSEYVSDYTVEILAVNGPAPSRVRLAFEKNVQRYQGVDKATVIDGKTYVASATEPYVLDANGKGADEEETRRVLDVFPDLGTRTQIDQVLPDVAMTLGEERHELAEVIMRVIHPRLWTMNKGSAVLSRVEGDAAIFAIKLDATGQSGIRMEVKGDARIRLRDARLMSIVLEGTYDHPKAAGDVAEPGQFALRRVVRDL